jgi:hypothetical protein
MKICLAIFPFKLDEVSVFGRSHTSGRKDNCVSQPRSENKLVRYGPSL